MSTWSLSEEKVMTEEEVKLLRQTIEEKAIVDKIRGRMTYQRLWLLVDLLTSTGCRICELQRLRVGDLFLDSRNPFMKVTGKGNKERVCYLPKSLVSHLRDWIEQERLQENDHVLISSHKKAYTTRGLQRAFKKCLQVSCLPMRYSVHSCRHSFATALLDKSKNLRLVQQALGHSSVNTTQIYTHILSSELSESVNNLF